MRYIQIFFLFSLAISINACNLASQPETSDSSKTRVFESKKPGEFIPKEFTRDSIISKIRYKKANNQPLVVHVFVPLCDNEHQGIVPVSKSLGNGMNLKTNLYWGAGYGIKTHFKRKKSWVLLSAKKNIDSNVLERVIFRKEYNSKTKVILIADAYRGDRMEVCLQDYFKALAMLSDDTIMMNDSINLAKHRDFLIFNGHNGLMEIDMEVIDNKDGIYKDAASISCNSAYYFIDRFKHLKAYPLITTQSLLPPEAYIVEGIIDSWVLGESEEEIRLGAGNAMYRVFKTNKAAMQEIFKTGW